LNEKLVGSKFCLQKSFFLSLVVYPQASPDIKYVFAFVRIQLSTSVTVCLVFCPKVLAIIRGQGENFEFHDRPGAQIPLNLNGTISQDGVIDVYQENEDLKVPKFLSAIFSVDGEVPVESCVCLYVPRP
jgi:hypothetical protein